MGIRTAREFLLYQGHGPRTEPSFPRFQGGDIVANLLGLVQNLLECLPTEQEKCFTKTAED